MKLQATVSLALIVLAAGPASAIVGGNPTTPEQYPYFAPVQIHKYQDPMRAAQCGGSVIDAGWILTAAHCFTDGAEVDELGPDDVAVIVRDTQAWAALEIILHPLWNGNSTDGHDLALVRIPTQGTEGNAFLAPAMKVQVGTPTYYYSGAYETGVIATVVGHGATHEEGSPTPELRDLHIPLRSDFDMNLIYYSVFTPWADNWDATLMIGAGWPNQTVCNGDSGGPLTVDRDGVTVQVGVVSFGPRHWYNDVETCDQPGGYAELSGPQLAWVAATVPGVAARWGTCWLSTGRVGLETPGRWLATYVNTGSDATGPDKDGTYRWKISCVPLEPVRKAPARFVPPPEAQ